MRNILIDANNLLYRAIAKSQKFSEINDIPRKVDINGNDLTSIEKFIFDLYYETQEFWKPETRIYVVWDRKLDTNAKNWRNDLNPLYKGNRGDNKSEKIKVHNLCPHIKRLCDVMGIYSVFPLSSECDDIINHLSRTLEGESLIVSADQDFFQCISKTTSVKNTTKKVVINPDNFEEIVGVKLKDFVIWKSLKGDTSDNLKGVPSYGDKRSSKLIDECDGDLKKIELKLSEEQFGMLEETIKIIDLNYKPLSTKELKVVDKQIVKKERQSDFNITKLFDKYKISSKAQEFWDSYFMMKDLTQII